ncbi:hypothetical protein BD311DRAFT_665865 [Dichomitus squalens]|uniref:DUF6534 domain-containing protein n=1 Tax=Dichomitus squalens TaxID=114155 RepID=A0A4Q9MIH8_9APHY|nr:hypothetical protein BD311DRAFT_665865 [Dichomitus squalens]
MSPISSSPTISTSLLAFVSDDIPDVQVSLAWVFFGLLVGLLFYGIMLCQVYWYFNTYKDPRVLRALVSDGTFHSLAETVHTALSMHWGYYYLVFSYGDPSSLSSATLTLALLPVTVSMVVLLCQLFYIRRVYLVLPPVYKQIFITAVTMTLLCAIGFSIAVMAQVFMHPTYKSWLHYKWLVAGAYGPVALGDLGIAIILVITLWKRHTGIKRTDALLKVLSIYIFSTGAFTSMLGMTCLCVDLFVNTNVMVIPFGLTSAHVYAFSVLVTLNLRQTLAQALNKDLDTEWVGFSALQRVLPAKSRRVVDSSVVHTHNDDMPITFVEAPESLLPTISGSPRSCTGGPDCHISDVCEPRLATISQLQS